MNTIFCCPDIKPYRPQRLDHEAKFTAFLHWANGLATTPSPDDDYPLISNAPYAVQLVRQVNYGPQEAIRYFVPTGNESEFAEATEDNLLKANFEKLNSYKNFRCEYHNKFFEVNLYQKSPANTHDWRANLARPSREIDLPFRRKSTEMEKVEVEEAVEREETQDLYPSPQSKRPGLEPVQVGIESPWATSKRESALSDSGKQIATEPDITASKRVLRFLLPTFGKNLGSNPLLSLLSIDWVNQELDLGLDFEALWEAQLTSSNILLFLCGCFHMSDGDQIYLADIEDLVLPAMRYVQSLKNRKDRGRARLQNISYRVLEVGRSVRWVRKYRNDVTRVLECGPSQDLLWRFRRDDDELRQDPSVPSKNLNHEAQVEKDEEDEEDEDEGSWMRYGNTVFDDYRSDDDDDDYGYESPKDYTACDKECGYCGHCDY